MEDKNKQHDKNGYLLCDLHRNGNLGLSARVGMPGGRFLPYEAQEGEDAVHDGPTVLFDRGAAAGAMNAVRSEVTLIF